MRRHERFGWDPVKASNNKVKHDGVEFVWAAGVLYDAEAEMNHVEIGPKLHRESGEMRTVTTGSHPENRALVLVTVWMTDVDRDGREYTRIISSRRATPKELRDYAEELDRRAGDV